MVLTNNNAEHGGRLAVASVCKVQANGSVTMGPVCSSWVWMCRKSSLGLKGDL
jgi:hypothetical protein